MLGGYSSILGKLRSVLIHGHQNYRSKKKSMAGNKQFVKDGCNIKKKQMNGNRITQPYDEFFSPK